MPVSGARRLYGDDCAAALDMLMDALPISATRFVSAAVEDDGLIAGSGRSGLAGR